MKDDKSPEGSQFAVVLEELTYAGTLANEERDLLARAVVDAFYAI
jgi:hypothetical protein